LLPYRALGLFRQVAKSCLAKKGTKVEHQLFLKFLRSLLAKGGFDQRFRANNWREA
jgi:hypothetical protein